jgi:RND family efflux transporter MFP subunit
MLKPSLLCGTLVILLVACGKPADRAAATGRAAATVAPSAALLLAPEDVQALQPAAQAYGPVVSGSLQPSRRADLRAEVSAVVLQVLEDNGERVRRGDLLVRLDDTSLRDTLSSADEAQRTARRVEEQAERQLQRLKTLQQQGMASTQAVEDAEIRRNSAQSDVVATGARVVAARQQLERTMVRAPFDGVVSERRVSVGDTVQVGRELLKVIDPASMRFEALVSADRMHELRRDQVVRFRVNGFPDQEFEGRVERIDPSANAATRQVAIVIAFVQPAGAPRLAGLFAEGRIETGSQQVLMVPAAALVRENEQAYAWLLHGAALQKVAVQLGERDPRTGDFPVLGGLQAGDRILRRPRTLVDGQKVEFAAPGALAGSAPPAK